MIRMYVCLSLSIYIYIYTCTYIMYNVIYECILWYSHVLSYDIILYEALAFTVCEGFGAAAATIVGQWLSGQKKYPGSRLQGILAEGFEVAIFATLSANSVKGILSCGACKAGQRRRVNADREAWSKRKATMKAATDPDACHESDAEDRRPTGVPNVGANYYTPELAEVEFRWKVPVNVHWTFPVKVHWESDSPLEDTADKWIFVGRCQWNSVGKWYIYIYIYTYTYTCIYIYIYTLYIHIIYIYIISP